MSGWPEGSSSLFVAAADASTGEGAVVGASALTQAAGIGAGAGVAAFCDAQATTVIGATSDVMAR
jgi:hypothetical protein